MNFILLFACLTALSTTFELFVVFFFERIKQIEFQTFHGNAIAVYYLNIVLGVICNTIPNISEDKIYEHDFVALSIDGCSSIFFHFSFQSNNEKMH